jgi:hypothetical protein
MKTFKQFSEQAYESYELVEGPIDYLKSKVKSKVQSVRDYPSTLRTAASSIRRDPIGSIRRGGSGIGKWMAKDELLRPVTEPLKKVTGNKPLTNIAIDTARETLSAVPWRQTAKTVVKQAPRVAKGAFDVAKFGAGLVFGGSRFK